MPISAGTHLGPYEIVAPIGAGGMGEVYRANDPRLHRQVAIKVADAQFSERSEREARAVAALNHPNICHIYDVGSNYIVMELVEGPTLAERIASGAIPLEEALGIARQIADALEAAHEKGIVHRDLKPANVKIKPDGMVKVLDFGLAKVVEESTPSGKPADSPTLTLEQASRVGVIMGTAAYMAPEQARGKVVDKRADIWAFGVVLYEMLTGRRLFSDETISDTLAAVLKEEPEWNRVPPKVNRLLRRCLEKDPRRRLRDIGDAWALLDEAPLLQHPARQHRWWLGWAAAALAAAAVLPLGFIHFQEKPGTSEQVRFLIPPPEKVSFISTAPSLSPDGRRIAFTAEDSDGRTLLWVRDLASLDLRRFTGTEGARYPFWSPDSHFIVFSADGKLKKIEASGGPTQTLCDAPVPVLGGSWNTDGVIIFGGPTGSVIYRVPAAGGVRSAVTKIDGSRREAFHSYPSFLPDGRHFIYQRVAKETGVYVGTLDAKPEEQSSRQLVATPAGAAYVPSSDPAMGRVLFLRDDTLLAQSIDNRRFELTGQSIPIAEHVLIFRTSGYFSASSNGVLAYRSGGSKAHLAWFDRQGKPLGAVGEAGVYRGVALSPDGTLVAVGRVVRHMAKGAIWLIELSTGAATQLTFDPGSIDAPVWSPDGSRIVFQSNRDGPPDLYQKPSSGAGQEELLLHSSNAKYSNDWSQDGRFLLYTDVDAKGKGDLWVLPDPGGAGGAHPFPYVRTEADKRQGQFSPNALWVAYSSNESSRQEVYVQPFPASSGSGGKWLVSKGGGSQPRWRRDGKELFYLSPDRKLMAVDVTTNTTFKAGVPKPLFNAPVYHSPKDLQRYSVTADGKRSS